MPNRLIVLDEPYIPEEQIAAGPSGIVYRGHDLSHARTVRLKVLLENHLSCPVDHATMQAYAPHLLPVVHPNVAALLALDVNGDEVTMISEFAEGINGWAYVQREPISVNDAQVLARQLLQALGVGEALHLPHGNVKPSNLIIASHPGKGCELKLLDWGLSHCRIHQPHETLALRAPECLLGGEATTQSDLFSAGATLAALLLGRLPVAGLVDEALYAAWQRFDADELRRQRPDMEAAWMEVLIQLMHLDPAQRHASALHAARLFSETEKPTVRRVFVPAQERPVSASGTSQDQDSVAVDGGEQPRQRRGCLRLVVWTWLVLVALFSGSAAWMITHRDNRWPPPLLKSLDQIEAVWQQGIEKVNSAIKALK